MFHTIHFYDLHRPGAHFESIVVNFAQILPSCKGYMYTLFITIKVNIIFFIKLLKGEAGGRMAGPLLAEWLASACGQLVRAALTKQMVGRDDVNADFGIC